MQPQAPMRLALAHTLEPAPMTQRLIALDGGSYAWTDDADLYPLDGGVALRRPHLPPVTIWQPASPAAPAPADVIAAIIAALDDQTWGVVDVVAVVERMGVRP